MDIIYEGKKPNLDMPYFGRQSRFFEFFKKCIETYLNDTKIYAETNSGSVSNAFEFAKCGYKVITNDISEYSVDIAKAVLSDDVVDQDSTCLYDWLYEYSKTYIDRASVFGACVELYGYNAKIPKLLTPELKSCIEKYRKHLTKIKNNNVRAYAIFNLDLFDYLDYLYKNNIKVDVMFMDFAWPWRDGKETREYDTTANEFTNIFNNHTAKTEIWNKNNVISNVLRALEKASKVSNYIFLSNQSSNFPTPELLEVSLLKNGFNYEIRHTMLTIADKEDNLLKDDFFREYLYVIKSKK